MDEKMFFCKSCNSDLGEVGFVTQERSTKVYRYNWQWDADKKEFDSEYLDETAELDTEVISTLCVNCEGEIDKETCEALSLYKGEK